MLAKIYVDSENSFVIPVLGATAKDSIVIRKVTGLSPPDVNLFIGEFSRDGGIYQGRRVVDRNVVLTMELNPNPALGETVAGLRQFLQKNFMEPDLESDFIKLRFEEDSGRVMYAVGYAEKFEGELFETDTFVQVSLVCPDPYLRNNVEQVLQEPSGWPALIFAYDGTAEAGFEATVYINAATSSLTLTNNTTTDNPLSAVFNRGRMVIDRDLAVGDVVTINTTRGERAIMLTPAGTALSIPLVSNLSPRSTWLQLRAIANNMRVYGDTPEDLVASIRRLRFRPAYWGL